MQPPFRVALVGYGLAGKAFHAPLISATPGLALAGVVTSRAAEVAADYPAAQVWIDLGQALADPAIDLVVLATPDHLHAPQAEAALQAGKHVVIDKPFAPTQAEAEAVAAMAAQSGRLLSLFHNRRWDADFLTLKALIAAGKLGEIRQFESRFDRWRPQTADRWKDQRSGGVWQDLGPHLVDQAIQLFGTPQAIMAELAGGDAMGAGANYAHVVLRQGEVRSVLHMSRSAHDGALRYLVHGSRGSYAKRGTDVQEKQSRGGMRPGAAGWAIDPEPGLLTRVDAQGTATGQLVSNLPGDYLAFYRQLRAAMVGEGANPVLPDQALDVMRVLDAGTRSAQQGCWVTL